MRGRKPKPTTFKILEGTRESRINRNEPRFPAEMPPCPDWLDPVAKETWEKLVRLLRPSGVITAADEIALSALCELYSFYRLAVNPKVPFIGPQRRVVRDAREQLLKYLSEFGMTPSSRSRIRAERDEIIDDLGDFLGQKKAK